MRPDRAASGQVLVIVAMTLVLMLVFTGLTIDVGRQVAEQRHNQAAADAGALAACRALIAGDSDVAAAAQARVITEVNLEQSPSGTAAVIAPDAARVYEPGHAGDPAYLVSGIIVSGSTVRVAAQSHVDAMLGGLVGVHSLEAVGRAHCSLQGGPALPIVVRRYQGPPGPGGGFVDALATTSTSGDGVVDTTSVLGYDVRTAASEADPGPTIELYGPGAKANNDGDFRGFIALDVRNYASTTSRVYYNGVTSGISESTLKDMEGAYLLTGYPGPAFPPVTSPADPNDQVGALSGNDTAMVVGNFSHAFAVGDRILLAVYSGTVMEIPDFSITPPTAIVLPATTTAPINGPSFTVSRNDAFNSTVALSLHGDHAASNPAFDLIPDEPPTNNPPSAGHMNQPLWSTNNFIPSKHGTTVQMQSISTNAVPAGIYTVWLEGESGDPYFQTRRSSVAVRIGGAVRDFSLANSDASAYIASLGGSATVTLYVSTTSGSSTRWGATGTPVGLTVDDSSFTDCSYGPASINPGQLTISPTSVTPSTSGDGAQATLTIDSLGLAPGCYSFVVRGTGTNGDGQPVTHVQRITLTVAATTSSGKYVDIIGFAVFEVTHLDSNAISGHAVSPIAADANDSALRRAQRARLVPW
jgi:Putative Flp pilus-assembly TadE/G-like